MCEITLVFKSNYKKVSLFNIFYIINTVWKQFTSKGRIWQGGIHFGKILFSGRFDSWLTQPFLPFRSVWCLDWWKSTFCEPLMGHVGPPEKPNVKLRPKLTTCMEALLALTCFSTTPSYKTVMVKLILLQIFSSTFFKCSSIFDTTSIISWMPKLTRIHTRGTSSLTHSPSTLFTYSNSTVLVKKKLTFFPTLHFPSLEVPDQVLCQHLNFLQKENFLNWRDIWM